MESYAGGRSEPAAVVQQNESNSYQEGQEEFPVNAALLEPSQETVQDAPIPESNPQAENFRALREEVDRMRAERDLEKRDHQVQLEMLRANQPRAAEPAPKEMFEGMKDEDIPNVGEMKREWAQREQNYQARLEELQVQQSHPDYMEVIEKYAIPLIKNKPHLAEGLKGATNKALFAYELGQMARQMQTQAAQAPAAPLRSPDAQKIVDNARRPGTLFSRSGGPSGSQQGRLLRNNV